MSLFKIRYCHRHISICESKTIPSASNWSWMHQGQHLVNLTMRLHTRMENRYRKGRARLAKFIELMGIESKKKEKDIMKTSPASQLKLNISRALPATKASHSPPTSRDADYSTSAAVSPAPLNARDHVLGAEIVPGCKT